MIPIGCLLAFSTVVVTELGVLGSPYPMMLPVMVACLAALVVGAVRHGVEPLPRLAVTTTGAFALLVGYAFVSALVAEQRIGGGGVEVTTLSKVWTVPVLVLALGTCLLALLAVGLVRGKDLPYVLWWFAVAGAVATPLGWLLNHEAPGGRLATRVGGAAVLHVALIIGLAIALAAWRSRHRPRLSLTVAVAYVAYLILSQSRAGIISLVVFVLLLAGSHLTRGNRAREIPRRAWTAVGLAVAALGAGAAFVFGQRSYDPFGGGRLQAWQEGLSAAASSVWSVLFGTGYGTLWPWHAFEQGGFQPDVGSVKTMPHGQTLAHAHNVYVSVAAELGLVGLLLLAPVVVAVMWSFRRATTRQAKWVAAALVASLVGFCFDTYLIKNFPVSLIWWCALFAVIRQVCHAPASGSPGPKG